MFVGIFNRLSAQKAGLATEPHEAIPGLYISSAKAARDKEALTKLGITHILTAAKALFPAYIGEYNYMLLDVQDWMGEDLLYYFDQAIKFIDEGRREGNVLVHCMAGVSRSASVVIAYIMHAEKVSFQVAFEKLKKARPFVHPNEAFRRQLQIFERWTLGVAPEPSLPTLSSPTSSSSSPPSPTTTTSSSSSPSPSSSLLPLSTPSCPVQGVQIQPASQHEQWEISMCRLLFRLEFLAGFEKSGIRKVVSGEDPHEILNQKVYDKLSATFDRTQPTYYKKGEANFNLMAQKGDDDDDDANEDSKEQTKQEMQHKDSESESEVEEGRETEGANDGEKEEDEGFTFQLDISEFCTPKAKKTREKQAHTVWVWSCTHCGRYLFTPLNITMLAPSHYEIEAMEWMCDIVEEQGNLSCQKCKKEIGSYNWMAKEGIGKEPPVPVFKIQKEHVQKQNVIVRV
eukprot:Phypoly_transcript_08913.p1 GENE.Phypoly_transcript_08913~~Phypoly_transcript_08913.p1  ORF type:complete len:456 (+),score=104.39 Phypoly_transcript_08913:70-1437(+)